MTAEPAPADAKDGIRRCAVLGSPIAHSLSPALHRAAYAYLGLSWTYERFEVTEPELAAFVAELDSSWRGLSLTMPLKVAVLDLDGEVDEVARRAHAGNTLVLDDARRRVFNTDVGGLVWALRRAGCTGAERVTILGSGATARSALLSAGQLGARQVTVLARTPEKARPLQLLGAEIGVPVEVRRWTPADVPSSDLVLSTAAAGAADGLAGAASSSAPVVFDAIYAPWPTALAAAGYAAGATVVGGLDLLVGQALLQLELMTTSTVPAEILYAALPESGRRLQSSGPR